MVINLKKGDRATFPNRSNGEVAGISTEFRFTAVRLWEHADRIRSGQLAELAPLPGLCESSRTVNTVREEIDLLAARRASSFARASSPSRR